ncbi:MAG TPA: zinc metalloprotease HtpX [Bryobacteraceae bacterium]|nr:zinc metalloprotease HtpX [Bryobacteraceae bacterium]
MKANGLRTAALLGGLSGLLLLLGQFLGGSNGLVMGFVLAIGMNFFSYFFSEKIALTMYRAQPVTAAENTHVYKRINPMVQELCRRMNIPVPRLWVIPDQSPNAFATGRNPSHSSVAFTAGLLDLMNDREVEGVLAHELGHIKNRDILTSSIAATVGAAITFVARMAMFMGPRNSDDDEGVSPVGALFMMILAPIAAMLIQMAISRTREFAADATAAEYCGTPDGLISGLQKLESWSHRIPMDASPATAHMFIIKPFSGSAFMKLFSTHPPTEERVAALAALRGRLAAV